MAKILVLSDTHSYLDPRIKSHIEKADQVWHAGDIGDLALMDEIKAMKPLVGVHGNIDDHIVKREYPKTQIFTVNQKKIIITHIAGYPGKYNPYAMRLIFDQRPDIFVCGHSHILKVMFSKELQVLHINPGAIGKKGFHSVQTAIRFEITEKGEIKNMEVIELTMKSES